MYTKIACCSCKEQWISAGITYVMSIFRVKSTCSCAYTHLCMQVAIELCILYSTQNYRLLLLKNAEREYSVHSRDIVNPRHTCAARATVVLCVSVCMSTHAITCSVFCFACDLIALRVIYVCVGTSTHCKCIPGWKGVSDCIEKHKTKAEMHVYHVCFHEKFHLFVHAWHMLKSWPHANLSLRTGKISIPMSKVLIAWAYVVRLLFMWVLEGVIPWQYGSGMASLLKNYVQSTITSCSSKERQTYQSTEIIVTAPGVYIHCACTSTDSFTVVYIVIL